MKFVLQNTLERQKNWTIVERKALEFPELFEVSTGFQKVYYMKKHENRTTNHQRKFSPQFLTGQN